MNLVEFTEQLVVDARKAVAMWGQAPHRTGQPIGTPDITLPVLRVEIAVLKMREAMSLLQECANVITVLDLMVDLEPEESETRRRIVGRVAAIALRMAQFQIVDPHVTLGESWRRTSPVQPPDPQPPNAADARQGASK